MLASTLVDAGTRIEELLTLSRVDVDLDNLPLKLRGKGEEERIVSFSLNFAKYCTASYRVTTINLLYARR